jgi:GntR family transcriptional regulator
VFENVGTREIGRGTFVAPSRIAAPMESSNILSLEEQLGLQRGDVQYKFLDLVRVEASFEIARALRIPEGAEVINISRVRLLRDMPFSFVVRTAPVEIGKTISADSLNRLSIHDILKQDLGMDIATTTGTISTVVATKRLADYLLIQAGDPLLLRKYVMSSKQGVSLVAGDRISAGGIIGGARDKVGPEAERPLGRFACLRRGADDGAIVLTQHIQPRTDVVGVPHGGRDAERRARERRAQLRDQFLESVFLGAVRTGQIAIEA